MKILGGENSRPAEFGVGGHVGEELRVAVGKRANGELLIQGREASWSVRPRVQEVPHARERDHLFRRPEADQIFGLEEFNERGVLELTGGDEGGARIVLVNEPLASLMPLIRKDVPGDLGSLDPDGGGDGCRRGVEPVRGCRREGIGYCSVLIYDCAENLEPVVTVRTCNKRIDSGRVEGLRRRGVLLVDLKQTCLKLWQQRWLWSRADN